jgi:hypothetical protein
MKNLITLLLAFVGLQTISEAQYIPPSYQNPYCLYLEHGIMQAPPPNNGQYDETCYQNYVNEYADNMNDLNSSSCTNWLDSTTNFKNCKNAALNLFTSTVQEPGCGAPSACYDIAADKLVADLMACKADRDATRDSIDANWQATQDAEYAQLLSNLEICYIGSGNLMIQHGSQHSNANQNPYCGPSAFMAPPPNNGQYNSKCYQQVVKDYSDFMKNVSGTMCNEWQGINQQFQHCLVEAYKAYRVQADACADGDWSCQLSAIVFLKEYREDCEQQRKNLREGINQQFDGLQEEALYALLEGLAACELN